MSLAHRLSIFGKRRAADSDLRATIFRTDGDRRCSTRRNSTSRPGRPRKSDSASGCRETHSSAVARCQRTDRVAGLAQSGVLQVRALEADGGGSR